jgi:archaemetzincin
VGIRIVNGSSLLNLRELERLTGSVKRVFALPVAVHNSSLDVQRAYDSSRRQYNSTALLLQLLATEDTLFDKIVAVVDVDLHVPVLTFVFGEAQLDGTAAIVSTQRLCNQFYGMEEDRIRMLERLEKEIVHELGHTFGLRHCHQFECVMRSSTYVEEIDLKQINMCPVCETMLKEKVKELGTRVPVR